MADLRALPSVDRLLGECGALVDAHGRAAVTDALRAALQLIHKMIGLSGKASNPVP